MWSAHSFLRGGAEERAEERGEERGEERAEEREEQLTRIMRLTSECGGLGDANVDLSF